MKRSTAILSLLLLVACAGGQRPAASSSPVKQGSAAKAIVPPTPLASAAVPDATSPKARATLWGEVAAQPVDLQMPRRYFEYGGKLHGLIGARAVALDPRTGRTETTLELPVNTDGRWPGVSLDGNMLVVTYDRYPQVIVFRVNLDTARIEESVDCTYDVEPFAVLPHGRAATHFFRHRPRRRRGRTIAPDPRPVAERDTSHHVRSRRTAAASGRADRCIPARPLDRSSTPSEPR